MKKELEQAKKAYLENKKKHVQEVDRDEIRRIREESVQEMDGLWKTAEKKLEENGFKIHFVENPEQVLKTFQQIVKPSEKIAKTKSNVIKEIGLLNKIKNQVTETDCGDFLVKFCDVEPEHPVTPALTLSAEEIAKKIRQKTGRTVKPEPEEIVKWAREQIRPKILQADVGLTGANAVTSEGSVFLLENEGNISLVSRIPKKHVIITSVDKIIRTNQQALKIMKALSVYGTGSGMASYVNIISGPSKTADVQKKLVTGMQGPSEVHVIVVDNGRKKLVEQGLGESLLCIGCGSCLYYCPAYQQLLSGFGNHYIGPKGLAMETDWKKLYSCTACLACKQECPVKINLLEILRKKRSLLESPENKKMMENIRRTRNPFGNKTQTDELYCC